MVCANYNCPGQLVISGSIPGIDQACEKLLAAGAKRALKLKVGGAFHSPLMEPARTELAAAIEATTINKPSCPVYQNVSTKAETCPETIKANLIAQLTAPVRWTQSVQNMIADGATHFIELGPGAVLQGLVKKINKEMSVSDAHELMRAAEVLNLLDLGEALMIAARERKESRGRHLRADFTFTNPLLRDKFLRVWQEDGTPRTAWRDRLK